MGTPGDGTTPGLRSFEGLARRMHCATGNLLERCIDVPVAMEGVVRILTCVCVLHRCLSTDAFHRLDISRRAG